MEWWKSASGYQMKEKEDAWLPPGFRFHPTDEELLAFYLHRKVQNANFANPAVADVDFNEVEPWDLPGRAKLGEKEWYFFSLRDRKYPTGMRTNRATKAGYWKATGKDREITCSHTSRLLGMKKTLVFYKGRVPKGEKTNWVIHEYRLEGSNFQEFQPPRPCKKEWVVCRVFKKTVPSALKSMTILQLDWRPCYEMDTSLPALESFQMQLTSSSSSPQQETPLLFHHNHGSNLSNERTGALTTDNIALGSSSTYMHLPTSSFSIANPPSHLRFIEEDVAAGFNKPRYPLPLICPFSSSNDLSLKKKQQYSNYAPVGCNIKTLYQSCINSELTVAASNKFAHNTINIDNPMTQAVNHMSYNEAFTMPLVGIPTAMCTSRVNPQEVESLWAV